MAFPREPWFEFEGRTLFVEEAAVMRWLSGKRVTNPIYRRGFFGTLGRPGRKSISTKYPTIQKRHYQMGSEGV